jgi:DNA-binding response OmpR family regulator
MTKDLKVLFVEDEKSIRLSLKETIGDEFKRFSIAKDGEEGLERFLNSQYDLVISDISMPKMSGLEMVAEIKKISKDVPIILLSAYSEKEKLLQAIDIGVTKYLIKPIDPEELLETISEIVEKRLSDNIIKLKNPYTFDLNKDILFCDKKIVKLTKKELLFVTLLMKNLGEITSKEDIKKHIWNDKNTDDTLLRTLVRRFRAKTDKGLVENFPALGYKISKYA